MFQKYLMLLSILLISLPLASTGAMEMDPYLAAQRVSFKAAQGAFRKSNLDTYQQLKAKLVDYPLYPYLRYEELLRALEQTPDRDVEQFFAEYPNTPLPYRLRGAWLRSLAEAERWPKFLDVYDDRKDTSLRCQYYYALIENGHRIDHEDVINRVWQVGYSQPKACDPLFNWLQQRGYLDSKKIWNRIFLAMEKGQVTLARYLSKKLSTAEQAKVKLWIQVHSHPDREWDSLLSLQDNKLNRRIAIYGIKRLVQHDVEEGRIAWKKLEQGYKFSKKTRYAIDRYIALLASYRAHPKTLEWFDQLSPGAITPKVRLWYARTALRLNRWDLLVETIPTLNATQRNSDMWRYWLARGLEQIGENQRAKTIYIELSGKRGYYGFLAADRLDMPYAINSSAIIDAGANTEPLMNIPGILRAHELYRLKRYSDARSEWNMATRHLRKDQQKLAARLAQEWDWHEMAVRMAAKVGELDDLELRFPAPFKKEVIIAADEHALPPSLVYGVMRRESIFSEDARSPAGALGLMQIMPATARHTADQLGLPAPRHRDLLNGDYNIGLGTGYLRHLLDEFDENLVLAVAAYNAGPHRVSDWLPEDLKLAADAWIDSIPFYETRRYLRAVLAYKTIYNWRLGQPCLRMSQLMWPVGEQDTQHSANVMLTEY